MKIIVLICVVFLGSFLEKLGRKNNNLLWDCVLCVSLFFILIPVQRIESEYLIRPAILIRGGESFTAPTVIKKRKKFSRVFHRRLEQHFPDWDGRMSYQRRQENFYKSALRKQRELKKLNIKGKLSYYSKEELDALDYFQGTGFYQKYQDPKLKPNIFDTRQTFLLKMHNPLLRKNFLNSLNHQND